MVNENDKPDPLQSHPSREWPSTPYSDEARAEEPPANESCCIAMIGDCTVACEKWPAANRPDNHLRIRLRRAFPGQPFVVRNYADSGGRAKALIETGRLDEILHDLPKIDIAFIRYGINDRKTDGVDVCLSYLNTICSRLREAYSTITTVIETGIWVDYPKHYMWDRNSRLAPLYDAMRAFVESEGYPVVDIFRRMEEETKDGNWDLRVRGIPGGEFDVLDDSLDQFYFDDPAFFSNIHPNSTCMGLIAEWEIEKIKELFGDRLPRG